MFDETPRTVTAEAEQSETAESPAVVSNDLTAEFEAMFGQDAAPAARTDTPQNSWDRYPAKELWEMLELSQQTAATRGAQLKTVENLLSVQLDIAAGQVQKLADLQQQIATAQQQIVTLTTERNKYRTERDDYLKAASRAADAHKKAVAQLNSATTANTQLQGQLADQKQRTEASESLQRATEIELNRTSLLKFYPFTTVLCALGASFGNTQVQFVGYLLAVLLFGVYLRSPARWWNG